MAIYRTDRDRRILGDRVVARKEVFEGIHSAVGEVHGLFAQSHVEMAGALEERLREENEDTMARDERAEMARRVVSMYSWAYHQVSAILQPSWNATEAPEDAETVRARLFPMGAPTVVGTSPQLVMDGMNHFIAAAGRETAVTYPEDFMNDARNALTALGQAIAKVTVESGETSEAVSSVEAIRETWDTRYNALREVAGGFLRLNGDYDRLAVLFRDLPKTGSGNAVSEPEPDTESEPVSEPGSPSETQQELQVEV